MSKANTQNITKTDIPLMTATSTRRAILAGVVALPVLSLPTLAADQDPILAGIVKHRRLKANWAALLDEQERLDDELGFGYDDLNAKVPLYPERELISSGNIEGDVTTYRSEWGDPTGKYYYAVDAKEIEKGAISIPKEHREAWIADRRAALAREKQRIRKLMSESGMRDIESRVSAASRAEYAASQDLLAVIPTTLPGFMALIEYVSAHNNIGGNDLMPDGSDLITLLDTLGKAAQILSFGSARR